MSRIVWALALVGLLGCTAVEDPYPPFKGRVSTVSDGDTFNVLPSEGGDPVRVRLAEVDCPESSQEWGAEARAFTEEQVLGETVLVDGTEEDGYGRLVAEITLPDGRSLNRLLVEAGLAWHYTDYSDDEELARLEAKARGERRGLWGDEKPVPPWDYRAQHR